MKLFYVAREMGNGLEQKNGANYLSPSFSLSSHELLWNNKHTKNQASILMPCSILSNHFVTWQVPLLVLANFSPQKMAWFQNWSRHRLGLVFCFQNCSDLLWEKIVLVIKKSFWNSRLTAENSQNFWDYLKNLGIRTVKGHTNFWNRMLFLTCPWRFFRSNTIGI